VSGERYLLDSHILLWLDSGNDRITPSLLNRLRYAEQSYLSAATAWELSLKIAGGKLRLRTPIATMLARFRLVELPVSICHGDCAAHLPLHHRDPFDRMLVAQAMVEGLILVTGDRLLLRYETPILLV
jgi:PIN domain nuclease of toxin-antitoxin system